MASVIPAGQTAIIAGWAAYFTQGPANNSHKNNVVGKMVRWRGTCVDTVDVFNRSSGMQILPPTVSPTQGQKSDLGGQGPSGAVGADPNPDKQHSGYMRVHSVEIAEEEGIAESLSSQLITNSPISSETQAALLALLSEPQPVSGVPSRSFDELVRDTAPGKVADVEDKDDSEYENDSDLTGDLDTLPGEKSVTEVEFN
jgi:hypothetical protein